MQAGEAPRRAAEFRASLRRRAQLQRAAEVIPHLPGPGESLHTLLTGYFDFALVLTCVLRAHPAPCTHCRISTLTFSRRNVAEMTRWLDERIVERLSLLCANYMQKGSPDIYFAAVKELAEQRGQVVGSARCHAKVATLAFADGVKLAFEGSANLRTNRNYENLCVANDAGLHDWHAAWIEAKLLEHQTEGTP
jgi:hypothetical protein